MRHIKVCEVCLHFLNGILKANLKNSIFIQIYVLGKDEKLDKKLFIFENTFLTKTVKINYHKFNTLITYVGGYLL